MSGRNAPSAVPRRRRKPAPRDATATVEVFSPATPSRREWRTAVIAVVLLWAGLFFPHLFLGQRVVAGDSSYYRPFAEFSRGRWSESRERTYWNPYVFMGIESVSSYADSRPQYLPDPLLDLTERLHEPAPAPQLWLLLAHLGAALSIMALARRQWDGDHWYCSIGAVVWLFAIPILGPFAHGFDAQMLTAAMLPVVLLGTHVAITGKGPRAMLLGALTLATGFALQALHGHPQILVYSAMLAAAFALQLAFERRAFARLLVWAGGVGLSAALGAAVWYPALLYSADSSRSGVEGAGIPIAVVAKYSYAWRDLLSLVWAQAVGFGRDTYWGGMQVEDNAPYLGALAVALAFAGLRRARMSAGAWFWWGVLVAGALLALGPTLGAMFEVIHNVVPFWSRFRVVSYVILWSVVAVAMLAARGASRAIAPAVSPQPQRWPWLALGAVAVLGLAIAFGPLRDVYVDIAMAARSGLAFDAAGRAARWSGMGLVSLALLLSAMRWASQQARLGRGWARPVIVALVALDLAVVIAPALWRASGDPMGVQPPPTTLLARVAAKAPHARVYVGAAEPVPAPGLATGRYSEAYTNFWISWRVRALVGNHGAYPGAWGAVIQSGLTRSAAALRAWGVQWYDTDRSAPLAPGEAPEAVDTRSRVHRLAGSAGRAYAVPLVVSFPQRELLVAAMQHPGFDPSLAAVTLDASVAGEYPGSSGCAIRWVRDDPERLELEVIAQDRAFVVVADSDAPGWTATINGNPAVIAPVNLMVRGVAMPAGRSTLVMTHATPGMALGTTITRAALALWALLVLGSVILELRRRRSGSAPQAGALGAH